MSEPVRRSVAAPARGTGRARQGSAGAASEDRRAKTIVALLFLSLAACVETRDPIMGTQSLRIELVSPQPGSPTAPLPDTARAVVVNITAIGADGQPDTSYGNLVQAYVNFLGTLTPYLGGSPLATAQMVGGKANNVTINLPPVFGPTTLWFDDGSASQPTYASGASPTLWYRDPFVEDISRPLSEMALDALSASPLEQKQVTVRASKWGANGRLVVTSVFAQGYTVSDMNCGAGGAPPCTTGDYDHVEVFSFSAARDEKFRLIKEGQVIDGFAGGVSEFNGLTEIGFPQTFVDADTVDVNAAREPAPAVLDTTWFTNKIMFERVEGAPIQINGGTVCALDKDYDTYKQWKLDPSGMCGTNRNVINVITSGVVNIDPATLVGKVVPRVVGILRPVNIGTFNVWIIYPRSTADLTLP